MTECDIEEVMKTEEEHWESEKNSRMERVVKSYNELLQIEKFKMEAIKENMRKENPSFFNRIIDTFCGLKTVYSKMPKEQRDKLPRYMGIVLAFLLGIIFASLGLSYSNSAE